MSKQDESYKHKLDTDMLMASTLATEILQQGFINRTFISIHKAYKEKVIDHAEYVKMINRLAAYKAGAFNDYLDILAGAASMGMLELAIQGELSELSPKEATARQQHITDITGVQPIQPEKE